MSFGAFKRQKVSTSWTYSTSVKNQFKRILYYFLSMYNVDHMSGSGIVLSNERKENRNRLWCLKDANCKSKIKTNILGFVDLDERRQSRWRKGRAISLKVHYTPQGGKPTAGETFIFIPTYIAVRELTAVCRFKGTKLFSCLNSMDSNISL